MDDVLKGGANLIFRTQRCGYISTFPDTTLAEDRRIPQCKCVFVRIRKRRENYIG